MGLDLFFETRQNVGYFRKINFLVAFFEKKGMNVEEQKDYQVQREDIIELIDACEQVLNDHSKAEELLPTCSGFFFGSTDYDEYYFSNVERILEYCKEDLLPLFDNDDSYLYFSIWY